MTAPAEEARQRGKMRVEEFLGSSRPRYAGKSEIDWRTRPVSERLRDADIDADAEVARRVDSEPWLNSANELHRWSVRKRGVGCASKRRRKIDVRATGTRAENQDCRLSVRLDLRRWTTPALRRRINYCQRCWQIRSSRIRQWIGYPHGPIVIYVSLRGNSGIRIYFFHTLVSLFFYVPLFLSKL